MPSKLLSIAILIALTGCFDLFTPTKSIPGPYYIQKSETGSTWSLYYDLAGAGHGRIDSISRIGWTDNYIFTESNGLYYFLDKTKDSSFLNADEIVIGPFFHDRFLQMLDSLEVKKFTFQIHLDK